MRNIETFPSKQMYPYLSFVERKEAEFYHNINRRRYLVLFKWLIFIVFPGQFMVSLSTIPFPLGHTYFWKSFGNPFLGIIYVQNWVHVWQSKMWYLCSDSFLVWEVVMFWERWSLFLQLNKTKGWCVLASFSHNFDNSDPMTDKFLEMVRALHNQTFT